MKQYKKNYLKFHGLTTADFIPCKSCSKPGVDLHHLVFKSQGGGDNAENLVALCRECHNKAHDSKEFNENLKKND